MAQPHAHSQPIETYGLAPHNRNIWPHNSRAPPSRLADSFVLQLSVYPLLTSCTNSISTVSWGLCPGGLSRVFCLDGFSGVAFVRSPFCQNTSVTTES